MKQLDRRLKAMEQQQSDQVDAILDRIAQRMKEVGQLADDQRDAGYQIPEGHDRMTIGERTLHALAWRHRAA